MRIGHTRRVCGQSSLVSVTTNLKGTLSARHWSISGWHPLCSLRCLSYTFSLLKPSTPPPPSLFSDDDCFLFLTEKIETFRREFPQASCKITTHLFLSVSIFLVFPLITQNKLTMLLFKATPLDCIIGLFLFPTLFFPSLLYHSCELTNQNKTKSSLTPCPLLSFMLLIIAKYSKELYFMSTPFAFLLLPLMDPCKPGFIHTVYQNISLPGHQWVLHY